MDPVTAAWYQRQSTISARAAAAVQELWRQIDPSRISESWTELLPQATAAVTSAQLLAATQADSYTAAQLEQAGRTSEPSGKVNPTAFVAPTDAMASLLYLPAITAKVRIAGGMAESDALLSAAWQLVQAAQTEAVDAGRGAVQVAMAGDRSVGGYRRALRLPSCSRCIVLAGKWFRWNHGFLRHPRCDCIHVPAAEAGDLSDAMVNPQAAFDSMSKKEQDRTFGVGARAIRDGADIGQVVNARRGMATAWSPETLEGATRRGAFYRRAASVKSTERVGDTRTRIKGGTPPRLSVREIYKRAGDDREEAVRLLTLAGYIL